MNNNVENLIRNARPQAPSPDALLARLATRGMPPAVGAGYWLMRAAALIVLAAGAGVVAGMIARPTVGSPAAGTPAVAAIEVPAAADPLWQALEQQRQRIEALEADFAREQQLRAITRDEVRAHLDERETAQRERHLDRHISHVRRHYARDMERKLEELEGRDLPAEALVRAREILVQHGESAEELIRGSYNGRRGGQRDMHRMFATLARETEDRLARVTGDNNWKDVLGDSPEDWGPTSEFEDPADYENMLNWMRRSSRS